MKIFSNLLLLTGGILLTLASFLIYQRYNPNNISFNISSVETGEFSPYKIVSPSEITIESQKIHLAILPTELDNGKWKTTSNAVSYLDSSPVPGEKGNSILYGHNWSNLLGNLPKVKVGDKITIKYSNGSEKSFSVMNTQVVKPNQTEVLDQTQDKRITLYTCTGFLDSKRFVVTAILNPVFP